MIKKMMRIQWGMGTILGVPLKMTAAGLIGFGVLFGVVTAVCLWLTFTLPQALLLSLGILVAHGLSDLGHQLGHAWVARRVGYPMRSLFFVWGLVGCTYPRDEPELAPLVHIKRALGGPIATFCLACVLGGVLLLLDGQKGSLVYQVVRFSFWENLVVIGFGALLPLGFTDGSTLLKWVPRWWAARNVMG